MIGTVTDGYTAFVATRSVIDEIYGLSKVVCALLVALVALAVVLEAKRTWSKLLLTALSSSTLALHYSIVAALSGYVRIALAPLVVIEVNETFGTETVSIDYGQLLLIAIALMWRKELAAFLKPRVRRVIKALSSNLRGRARGQTGEAPGNA